MKYFLLLSFLTIVSCNEKSNSSNSETPPPPEIETETESKYNSTWDYIFDNGIAHVLEHKLENYELKAAVINSFHSLLFYYNEDLQQVCCYVEEILTVNDRDNAMMQINGKEMRPNIWYYLTEEKENSRLIPIDFEKMTPEKRENFEGPGISLAYGFKLKQTDTFHFSINLIGNQSQQKVEITYDPNYGWRSNASQINTEKIITANIYTFGKEKIIDQLKRLPNKDKECIIRTRPLPNFGFSRNFDLDNNYGDFSAYPIEIGIEGKTIYFNDDEITIYQIEDLIKKEKIDPYNPIEARINLSNSSNEDTVKELLKHLVERYPEANFAIGIK